MNVKNVVRLKDDEDVVRVVRQSWYAYFGKMILVVVMFIGRLGPLSIALALSGREPSYRYQYAEENVMIG